MRKSGGGLRNKIHSRLERGGRIPDQFRAAASEKLPDNGSALHTEVLSEDFKLLRTLLLAISLLSFVYIFQANERGAAVQVLIGAYADIAGEAVFGSKMTSPKRFKTVGAGVGLFDVEVSPINAGRQELVVDLVAQTMLELELKGFTSNRESWAITVFSPTLNSNVEMMLRRVDRPPALQAAVERDNAALLLDVLSKTNSGNRQLIVDQMSRIEQRCPDRWLRGSAKYRVFKSVDSADWENPKNFEERKVARLRMGDGTWSLSNFRLVNERGTRSPMIASIEELTDFRLYFFREAMPSYSSYLDCENNFVVHWGVQYFGMPSPALIDAIEDDGQISADYREVIANAQKQLNKLSVRLTEGVDFGIYGVFLLIPLALIVLSVWLSVALRRLASRNNGDVRHLLLDIPLKGRRLTALDGPHFFYLERIVRAICIAYPIIAPPLVVLSVPIVMTYPSAHVEISVFFGSDVPIDPAVWQQIAKNLLMSPPLYVASVLLIQSTHQMLITFGRGSGSHNG